MGRYPLKYNSAITIVCFCKIILAVPNPPLPPLQNPLVLPAVTPRFAPTCPEDQMSALAQLASDHDCHIQTHLCETQPESNWVKELFPWSKSYTEVYDTMRLLGEKVSTCWGTPLLPSNILSASFQHPSLDPLPTRPPPSLLTPMHRVLLSVYCMIYSVCLLTLVPIVSPGGHVSEK